MRSLLLALPALLLAACYGSSPVDARVDARLDTPFTLQAGGRAEVEDAGILVRFEEVLDDSRCAVDVQCVWAGDARVRIQVSLTGEPAQTHELHTGVEPRSVDFQGYRVTLEALDPAPRSTVQIRPEDYAATLRVTVAR